MEQSPSVRILQVTSTNERRGAETFAHQLGGQLRGLGHHVTTAALQGSGDRGLPMVVLGPGRRSPATWAALVGAVRAHDVVVSHGGSTLGPVAAASGVVGRPFAYRNIGDPTFWATARGAGLRVGLPLRRAAAVMALYGQAGEFLIERYGLRRERVHTTRNAVDPTGFRRRTPADVVAVRAELGLDPRAPVIAYVGALSAEKRPEWALDCVEPAPPGTTLLMAGGGPLETELRAATAGRSGIRVMGAVADPGRVLTAADVLVIPSATEGVPAVLLEAALVGVPVVATAVGGVPEVASGLGGSVVVDPDDEAGLVRAVQRTLSDPPPLPPEAEVLERHGIAAVAAEWDAVLRSINR